MSVISVQPYHQSINGSWKLEHGERHYSTTAIVRTNARDDSADTVMEAARVHFSLGLGISTYGDDPYAILTEMSAQFQHMSKEGAVWIVSFVYTSSVPLETSPNPLDWNPVFSCSVERYNKPILEDFAGLAILNSAKEVFESPPEAEQSRLKYSITKNYPYDVDSVSGSGTGPCTSLSFLDDLIDSVNSSTWHCYQPYQCKMNAISFKVEKVNSVKFYAITFEILADTHRAFHPTRILDTGYRDKTNKTFLDLHGQPKAKPTLLDGDGLELAKSTTSTVTISNASPAVVSWTAHGLTGLETIQFSTTGALPSPLQQRTTYYVVVAGLTANTFQISATFGGAAINTTTAGSGVHTAKSNLPEYLDFQFNKLSDWSSVPEPI